MLNIVLYQPEIPQNTGNIARTCVALGAKLHLIHPLGFSVDERQVRRAGLDYWKELELVEWENEEAFFSGTGDKSLYYLSTKAGNCHSSVSFPDDCYLLFGPESRGLPEHYMKRYPDTSLRIPMRKGMRSLNLSNAVAIVAYEYWRQRNFEFEA